jgi:hypothetical protein
MNLRRETFESIASIVAQPCRSGCAACAPTLR